MEEPLTQLNSSITPTQLSLAPNRESDNL
jgi:protein tyrosine phosphatase